MASFDLKHYKTEQDAQAALEERIPLGTPRDKTMETLSQLGLDCHVYDDKTLTCRYVERSFTMAHTVWNLVLHFDENEGLREIVVNRGLTGP